METHITINYNGKELHIPVNISEEQVHQIYRAAEAEEKMTGWEAPMAGNIYFYEDALCRVQSACFDGTESAKLQADMLYTTANCYSSKTIANNIARGDTLIRALRRFAVEHSTKEIDYMGGGYTIMYNHQEGCLEVGHTGHYSSLGDILFETEEIAQLAINKYRSELIWYFTERVCKL